MYTQELTKIIHLNWLSKLHRSWFLCTPNYNVHLQTLGKKKQSYYVIIPGTSHWLNLNWIDRTPEKVAPKLAFVLGFPSHILPRGCEERKHVKTWRVMIWVSQFCLSSQLLFQGTACATAEIVTAGMAGPETPVKSGLERRINPW